MTSACTLCRDVGWILDCNPQLPPPVMLELIACPLPDCACSGQTIQSVAVNSAHLTKVSPHPRDGYVMSLHTPKQEGTA